MAEESTPRFEIRTNDSGAKITQGHYADFTFTVRSQLSEPVEADILFRLQDAPVPAGAWAAWLKPEEDRRWTFIDNSVKTYRLRVNVPQDAVLGDYTFQVVFPSAENPDELYGVSEPVSFAVVGRQPSMRWFILGALILAVFLIVGAVVLALYLNRQQTLNVQITTKETAFQVGKPVEYDINIKNDGKNLVRDVVLAYKPVGGVVAANAHIPNARSRRCDEEADGRIFCYVGDLAAGKAETVKLTAVPGPTALSAISATQGVMTGTFTINSTDLSEYIITKTEIVMPGEGISVIVDPSVGLGTVEEPFTYQIHAWHNVTPTQEVNSILTYSVPDRIRPLVAAGSSLDIVSSEAAMPLAFSIPDRFREAGFSGEISVFPENNDEIFADLCDGFADIAFSSRPISDAERSVCQANDFDPIGLQLGSDAQVVVVHPDNPLQNVTLFGLQRIFGGQDGVWDELASFLNLSDLGGAGPMPVRRLLPGPQTSAYNDFVATVFGGDDQPLQNADIQTDSSDNIRADFVAGDPGVITILPYTIYRDYENQVRALSIDGVGVSEESVQSGQYPLTIPLYLYTTDAILDENPLAAEFVDQGLKVASVELTRSGLIPAAEENLQQAKNELLRAGDECQQPARAFWTITCPLQIVTDTTRITTQQFEAIPTGAGSIESAFAIQATDPATATINLEVIPLPNKTNGDQVSSTIAAVDAALRFDGLEDWAELGYAGAPGSFTVEMWVHPFSTDDGQNFIGAYLTDTQESFAGENLFRIGYEFGGLEVLIYDRQKSLDEEQHIDERHLVNTLKTTERFHLGLVVEQDGDSSLVQTYINGELQEWCPEEGPEEQKVVRCDLEGPTQQRFEGVVAGVDTLPWVLAQDWDPGQLGPQTSDFFKGTLSEVRIWDGVRRFSPETLAKRPFDPNDWQQLLGYWPMAPTQSAVANVLPDRSPHRRNGEIMGGATWGGFDPRYGLSLAFDGVDDRLDAMIDRISAPYTNNSSELTLASWINVDSVPSRDEWIIGEMEPTTFGNLETQAALLIGANGHVMLTALTHDAEAPIAEASVSDFKPVLTGQWAHYAGTVKYDDQAGELELRLFRNGELVAARTSDRSGNSEEVSSIVGPPTPTPLPTSPAATPTQVPLGTLEPPGGPLTDLSLNGLWLNPQCFEGANFYIGGICEQTAVDAFRGRIDEIRVWSKVLEEHEIRSWMARPGEVDGNHIAYWPLDDGPGRTSSNLCDEELSCDFSVGENHLSVFGPAWSDTNFTQQIHGSTP